MDQSLIIIQKAKLNFVPLNRYSEFEAQVINAYEKIANSNIGWVPNYWLPKVNQLESSEDLELFLKKIIGVWMFGESTYDYDDYWEDELEEEDLMVLNSSAADYYPVYSMDVFATLNHYHMSYGQNGKVFNSPIKGVW
jgi:hypothetical protein